MATCPCSTCTTFDCLDCVRLTPEEVELLARAPKPEMEVRV
jgi:hypothetical protein